MGVIDLLKHVPEFSKLTCEQLADIDRTAERRSVTKGEMLIREGDRAKRVFVVLSGKFVVLSKSKPIAEVLPGEPIGELAFFAGGRRTSDVVAARDSEVLQLDRRAYGELSRKIPELSHQILKVMSRRLVAVTPLLAPLPPRACKTIAIVPAGGEILPDAFVETLRDAVTERDGWIVTGGPRASDQKEERLRDYEREHERIFLICSGTESEAGKDWLSFATRNCDCVCLVVDSADETAARLAQHEPEIIEDAATCPVHVVLWSDESADERGSSAMWLVNRPTNLRHHVCGSMPETVERWLRFLSGNALGVVLCGGGALGTAHLGAVKALLEHGYEIDIFGGTSVGAAMAAALASQMPPDDIMDNCDEIFVRSKAMSRLTVPVHSLLDHHTFDAQLKKHYGGWDIEDLPLNYFAVSTSLTTNDMHIHRTGSLWKTVRASGSIPAILPPMIKKDGEVLVDGALIDNLPVDVMRQIKAGPNIIFNFQDQKNWRVEAPYEKMPTRWQTLWRFITKSWLHSFPSITTVLSKTMVVTARRRQSGLDLGDDILIEMPVPPQMGTLDWSMGRKQYDLAYETMNGILERAEADKNDNLERRLAVLRKAAWELSSEN